MGLIGAAGFHFLHPAWLWALPPLMSVAAWFAWRRRSAGGWSQIIDAKLLPALRLQQGDASQSPWFLIGLAWVLAALALAGPAWQRVESPAFRAPEDWVLLLDLSPSMAAGDLSPDRATRARYAIEDLLSAAQDARVALVVFAGEAHTVVPLTADVATIRALLQPLSPSVMPESGDDVAPALDEAARLLRAGASQRAQVLLLSDGFVDPAEGLAAAQRLKAQGAALQVIGIGTVNGAPAPDGTGGFVHDAEGKSVLTKLPEDQLQRLASAGGGRYWNLEQLRELIAALHAESANPLKRDAVATERRVDIWRNEGVWLLPPLLLLTSLLARRGWL